MFTPHSKSYLVGAAALVALAIFAAEAPAGWLGFRNDLNRPVVVHCTSKVNGTVHRCPPHYLRPGEIAWTWVRENSVRQVTIREVHPPRTVLSRFEAKIGRDELFYAIQDHDEGGKEKAVQAVRIDGSGPRPRAAQTTKSMATEPAPSLTKQTPPRPR